MTDAALIVALANAKAVRRPTGARASERRDELADATRAGELLAPYVDRPVSARDLPALRELQRAVAAIADALIDGRGPPLARLNRLAAQHPATRALEQHPDGSLRVALRAPRAPLAAALTDRAIDELERLEPRRLRRCARPECSLVFYDRTRSATQRWHSERPCGLRERQRRHRSRPGDRATGDDLPGRGSQR